METTDRKIPYLSDDALYAGQLEAVLEENAALCDHNVSLMADVDAYRALALEALGHVAALTRRNDALTEENRELRNDVKESAQ